MTYTAPGAGSFRAVGGSLAEKVCAQLANIDTELDTATVGITAAKIKIVDLTPSAVTTSSLAGTGVSLATDPATAVTWYSTWVAPVACTIISMDVYFTQAYAKATGSASIVLQTEAGTPVVKATYAVPDAGVALRAMVSTVPSSTSLAAGTMLNLVVTPTTVTTGGTGHAKVFMRYTVN